MNYIRTYNNVNELLADTNIISPCILKYGKKKDEILHKKIGKRGTKLIAFLKSNGKPALDIDGVMRIDYGKIGEGKIGSKQA